MNWIVGCWLRRTLILIGGSCALALPAFHAEEEKAPPSKQTSENTEAAYHWFSMPIEVKGVSPKVEFVPVTCTIDFTEILSRLKVPGAVDERSLRLSRVKPDGSELDEPVQFSASPQPRPKERRLLPGTSPNLSYLGEYRDGETPAVPRVAGELSWVLRNRDKPRSPALALSARGSGIQPEFRYRLRFGIARAGRLIQVPFSPQNLRGFDEQGRATPIHWFPQMQIRPQWPAEGVVHISDNSQLLTTYHIGPALGQTNTAPIFRRPFLYPVIGPDGISLTEIGKPHDPTGSHAHHYSLWISHFNVNGKDFWSEKGGMIANEQLELMEDGPLFCRLLQRTRWLFNGADLLHEKRQLTFYQTPEDFRLIDINLEFTPGSSEPVVLGQTTFGFLAARVAQSMTVFDGGGEILNANGDRNEQAAHLKRAAWMDQSGPIAPGKWGGIAILDHPENAHHPTGWHCRNDGWAGAAFNMDSPYTIERGAKLRLRYRIHLHRHNALEGGVARRYEEYSEKPAIQIGPASMD
jgi:hypothetical protein